MHVIGKNGDENELVYSEYLTYGGHCSACLPVPCAFNLDCNPMRYLFQIHFKDSETKAQRSCLIAHSHTTRK